MIDPDPSEELTDILEELAARPSVLSWLAEIERILTGRREHAMVHLGDASAYTDTQVLRARDIALARSCLLEALTRRVAAWTPGDAGSTYQEARLLELLRAYRPAGGEMRVLAALQRGSLVYPGPQVNGEDCDLTEYALAVLDSYFPMPPGESAIASPYPYYLGLLEGLACARKPYSGLAAARLIVLRHWEVTDERLLCLGRQDPAALMRIVLVLASYPYQPLLQTTLAELVGVMASERSELYQSVVDGLALARIERRDWPSVELVFPNGTHVPLPVASGPLSATSGRSMDVEFNKLLSQP